jgi:hypothetical protein
VKEKATGITSNWIAKRNKKDVCATKNSIF